MPEELEDENILIKQNFVKSITTGSTVFLFVMIFICIPNYAFAEIETGSLEVTIKYTGGDRAIVSNAKSVISQDLYDNYYAEIESISDNPFQIDSLPLGHTYFVSLYIDGIFAGESFVDLEKANEEITLTIPASGGLRFTVLYEDGQTPIDDATVSVQSSHGHQVKQFITDSEGNTARHWIQSTSGSDNYTPVVSLGSDIEFKGEKFKLSPGLKRDIKIVTTWPSVIDSALVAILYDGNTIVKNSGYVVKLIKDGIVVEEKDVNHRGQAYFTKLSVGNYQVKVLKYHDDTNELDDWGSTNTSLTGTERKIKIFRNNLEHNEKLIEGVLISGIEQSFNILSGNHVGQKNRVDSCNCVAFRLDDIQNYWLNDVQIELLETFNQRKIPVTAGIIAGEFGEDQKVFDQVVKMLNRKEPTIEIANHGWLHEDFTKITKNEQSKLLHDANKKLLNILGIQPVIFIPPLNTFNDDTLKAMKENKMSHISSSTLKDSPPFPLKNSDIYRFPEEPTTGIYDPKSKMFVGVDHQTTFNHIQESIENYGFAVITMHQQEFSVIQDGTYTNQLNSQQFDELELLLDNVQESELRTVFISTINANSETYFVPQWIKNNAGWWATSQITDSDFIVGIEFLIKEDIIRVSEKIEQNTYTNSQIPSWIKNNAGWWSTNMISEKEFVNGIEFLVSIGIIIV